MFRPINRELDIKHPRSGIESGIAGVPHTQRAGMCEERGSLMIVLTTGTTFGSPAKVAFWQSGWSNVGPLISGQSQSCLTSRKADRAAVHDVPA